MRAYLTYRSRAKADVISSALFEDGAAVAVLRAGPGAAELRVGTGNRSGGLPGHALALATALVEQRMAAPVRRFMKAARLQAPQLICHPGGAKVLDAIEVALELQKGTLRDEREVLRGNGNMSPPTVLFVLERTLRCGLRGPAILSALGPGFTANFLALEVAHG